MSHTQGPWSVEPGKRFGNDPPEQRATVADVFIKVNAELIATAPELLAAVIAQDDMLSIAYDMLEAHGEDYMTSAVMAKMQETSEQIRRIVEKTGAKLERRG
jgi:hypothetical protein